MPPAPRRVRWSAYLRQVAIEQKKATDEREALGLENLFRPFEEYSQLRNKALNTSKYRQRVLTFHRCRQELLRRIDETFDMRPSPDQTRLFDLMSNTMLLKIYENDANALLADFDWLKDTFQVDDTTNGLIVEYPRRSGKSWTEILDSIVTVLALDLGSVGNVYCVSPMQKQATDWLAQFIQFIGVMRDHPEFGYAEVSRSQGQCFVIRSKYTGKERTVTVRGNASNKSNVNALRGGGKGLLLLILDEFNFFCDEAFAVLLPLIANGAAIVLTSSMAVKATAAAELAQRLYKDGTKALNAVRWRLGCAECMMRQDQTGELVRAPSLQSFLLPLPSLQRAMYGSRA